VTTLPELSWHESPNHSSRRGIVPYLIVVHRPVSSYASALRTLTTPAGNGSVSAHVLTEHDRATQLVPWDEKAWSCVAFNAASYNLEVDDNAWDGTDSVAWRKAARLVAYLCHKTGIPATWTQSPTHTPGVCRHYDLGRAGGGHTDPTTDAAKWRAFMQGVRTQLVAGGFRDKYGRGYLEHL
jgi:hypothetical protein